MQEYAKFVDMIRNNLKTMKFKKAVKKAVDDCISEGILRDFLLKIKSDITVIGNVDSFAGDVNDILYVVYTERNIQNIDGKSVEVIRLISARLANDFERGLYYGKIY